MKSILAALDFSDVTDGVVAETAVLPRAFGTPLYLLHVEAPEPAFIGYEPSPQSVRDQVAHSVAENRRRAHAIRDELIQQELDAHSITVQGPTGEKILSEAKRLDAGIIVMGSHGHSTMHDLLAGSVTKQMLNHAHCPVLVVPSSPGRSRTD